MMIVTAGTVSFRIKCKSVKMLKESFHRFVLSILLFLSFSLSQHFFFIFYVCIKIWMIIVC